MIELFGMAYSPWTLKSRWALSHHRLDYRYHEHLLIFEMPLLRWKLRRFTGDVTLPALVDGHTRLIDSFEISKHVDRLGKGTRLFPEKNLAEIRRIDEMADSAGAAGRALVLGKLAREPEAQLEYLPSFVPGFLKPFLRFLVSIGSLYIQREFRISLNEQGKNENHIHDTLAFLRAMLRTSGGEYVLGEFSYADIAMASVVQVIAPFPNRYMRARPAVLRLWTHTEFSAEFRDLVEWRDRLYSRHAGPA
jgi:glutathione S-transferase